MRTFVVFRRLEKTLWALAAFAIFNLLTVSAEVESGRISIKSVQGQAVYSVDHHSWFPIKSDITIPAGAVLKTGPESTIDLVLQDSRTVLRVVPDTELELTELNKEVAGEDVITETRLNLKSGGVVGSQRKLSKPSTFTISSPKAVATIVGTEYLIRADGAVTCLDGEVSVNYNLPGNGGSVRVTVPHGSSFNPVTGEVVPTTPEYLANIIQDINTVRNNAQTFKAGGATIVVNANDKFVSPTHGNNGVGNGQDPQPPGNPPTNDGPGSGPGNPGNR
jgi:hypothetical protein